MTLPSDALRESYQPDRWFFGVIGKGTWSVADKAYVDQWPANRFTRGIESEKGLSDRLRPYGLVGPVVSVQDVKDEARRRILAVYPEWKQANMTARGVELTRKLAQGDAWTEAEEADAEALQDAWGWIRSVRTASDAIEAMTPIPLDFCDDSRWPASA